MSERRVQFVGAACGQHGNYNFYKAFSFSCAGRRRALAIGEFFFVQLWASRKEFCIGELQLVFEDTGNSERLACLRLYFLPEYTPEGRQDTHGEDEVLAVQERLTVRLEELADVVIRPDSWASGWQAGSAHDPEAPPATLCTADVTSRLRLDDVDRTKRSIGDTISPDEPCVLVLNYDHYCRLRGVMKRLEAVNPRAFAHAVVRALGGVRIPSKNTRLLYCRDLFEYPELDGHEMFCNHLAPKLRGRSRRKVKESSSPSSESTSDTESLVQKAAARLGAHGQAMRAYAPSHKPSLLGGLMPGASGSRAYHQQQLRSLQWSQKEFIQRLYKFMSERGTPIIRVPGLGGGWGLQPVNLHRLYRRVQELGGYQSLCLRNLWKQVFHEMGGDRTNHAGAAHTRRTYEKLCLPFERMERGAPSATIKTPASQPQQQQRASIPAGYTGTAMLTALAQSRPAITITAVPQAHSASTVSASASRVGLPRARGRPPKHAQPPPRAHQSSTPRPPTTSSSNGGVEVVDLTSGGGGESYIRAAMSATAQPISKPTRIGSITITPVEKTGAPAAPSAVAPPALGSMEQLMALHMASTSVSPQMLQFMATSKASGFEQIQRAQQQLALHTLMAQRMSMMSTMPGLSKEQVQANVEAYKRLLQSGFRKS